MGSDNLNRLLERVHARADRARRTGGVRSVVDELILTLLLHAGIKAVELCRLTITDVGGHRLHIRDREGRVERTVTLDDHTATLVERFVDLHREGAKAKDPLLVSERGRPLGYMSVYNRIRRMGQQGGVAGISPQVLRHAYIVQQFHAQGDLRRVQRLAGHAHIKTTARHLLCAIPCDVCETAVRLIDMHRIDSGHHLCPTCFKDLRQPR